MHPDIPHSTSLYALFFALAHVVTWCIVFWYGYKHRYPLIPWLLIITTGFICFTIGTHVFAIDFKEIKELVINGKFLQGSAKSLIGGLLLAVPAMLLVKNLLKFHNDVFSPYAFAILLSIAIQRIGCFFSGCCYGKLTEMPWGIHYSHGFSAHIAQWEQGLISTPQLNALAVHPVQLYESFLCLVAFTFLIVFSKLKWFHGPIIYLSLLFYSIIRLTTEFFRAHESQNFFSGLLWGINTVQWMMIGSIFLCIYILAKQSKVLVSGKNELFYSAGFSTYFWFFTLFIIILFTPAFYSQLERLLLGVLFIPLSSLVFWEFFKSITIPQLRWTSAALCVTGFFIMSQTSPLIESDTLKKGKNYHEIGIGGYAGYNMMSTYTEDCDGKKTPLQEYKENYYLLGAGYKFVKEISPDKRLTLGIGGSYGELTEHIEELSYDFSQIMYSVNPYVQYDLRSIGIGLGFAAGDISLFHGENYAKPFSTFTRYSLLPMVHLRTGNLEHVWGEFNYGYRFPGFAPSNEFEILLGVHGYNGNILRAGTSSYHALVLRPEFNIQNKVFIEPYIGILGPLFSGSYMNRMGYQGGLNLRYRIY